MFKLLNIYIYFSGDFYQLPPTLATYIFQRPDGLDSGSSDFRGYHSWKNGVTHVIILTENLRQTDQKWKEILARFRTNQQTLEDIEFINERIIEARK